MVYYCCLVKEIDVDIKIWYIAKIYEFSKMVI